MGRDGTEKKEGFKIKITIRKIPNNYCHLYWFGCVCLCFLKIKPSSVTSIRSFLKWMEFCTIKIIKSKTKFWEVF
jgi:hypothetical protein